MKKRILCFCFCAVMILILALPASALPELRGEPGARVKQTDKVMKLDAERKNVVVEWNSFNLTRGEVLVLDNGDTSTAANNYLFLIHDAGMSAISGTIRGGNNVYIVNPNGVVFGADSRIEVGNLHVSACSLDRFDTEMFQNGENPVSPTPFEGAGDIIGLGKVNAGSVSLEGNNVYLSGSARGTLPAGSFSIVSNSTHIESNEASMLSIGYPWTVVAVVIAAIAAVVVAFCVVKKKKPAAADTGDGE